MKFTALFAAVAATSSALAAPASELNSRQIVVFPEMVAVTLTSNVQGTFLDRTNYGTKTTPRLEVDPSVPAEKFKYAFLSNTDPKAFTWTANGKKLQCTLEVKDTPSSSDIELNLESLYTRGTKKNVGGYPITTNCFAF